MQAQNPVESAFYTSRNWQAYLGPLNSLYGQLTSEVIQLTEKRGKAVSDLKTKSDWENYRKNLREAFYTGMIEFKRTPLNPKITGKIEKQDYTIEKVVFESFPQFYVTGCLFIPKVHQKPAPAVIYCSGHSADGFRGAIYMRVILNLVQKGFVVFAYDPIGQGERLQYPDEKGKSLMGGPTSEHAFAGIQSLLTGHSLSDFFVWDGVRAVDFFLSRPEVDASRIGITGRSGGGTQSAMISAYDERIQAAAPECYISGFRRLFESIGPQDAEQNPFQSIKKGFDHADFFHLRAPKPSLMITTLNDFFSIQGAREVFAEAKQSYKAYGEPGNMMMVEDLGIHESTLKNREAMYAFFRKALNNPGDSRETAFTMPDSADLVVTTTGQVVTSLKSKTVYDLIMNFIPSSVRMGTDKEIIVTEISAITGLQNHGSDRDNVYTGRIKKEDFYIEKYFVHAADSRYALPYFVVKSPTSDNKKMIILVSPEGKSFALKHESIITRFTKLGFLVVLPDLPGTGELALTDFKGDSFVKGKSYNHFFGANLIGKCISGIQASDLELMVDVVQENFRIDHGQVFLVAENEMCQPSQLFALRSASLNQVLFIHPLVSYRSLAETRYYDPTYMMTTVPGILKKTDIPELLACLAPAKLTLINPVDGSFKPIGDLKPFTLTREAYRTKKSGDNFQIQIMEDKEAWDYAFQKIANN